MTCWKIPAGKTPKTRDNINFQLCLWIRDWWARENLYKREFIYCYKWSRLKKYWHIREHICTGFFNRNIKTDKKRLTRESECGKINESPNGEWPLKTEQYKPNERQSARSYVYKISLSKYEQTISKDEPKRALSIVSWRVWSWLRTNAGGVLNTCKSNESVEKACFFYNLVANGWVTRKQPALRMGTTAGNGC